MSITSPPRETRVRPRGVRLTPNGRLTSVKADFIPADLSPVSTHALEMDKGRAGWTDTDKKIETVTPTPKPDPALDYTIGSAVIRRDRNRPARTVTGGPTASYRARVAAAQRLAAAEAARNAR